MATSVNVTPRASCSSTKSVHYPLWRSGTHAVASQQSGQTGAFKGLQGRPQQGELRCPDDGPTHKERIRNASRHSTRYTGCQPCLALGTEENPDPRKNRRPCKRCDGLGIVPLDQGTPVYVPPSHEHPFQIGIVGGGMAGVTLALALHHRGIRCSLFERDTSFNCRSQGYGITVQQAFTTMRKLGASHFVSNGVTTKRHTAFRTTGEVLGSYGGMAELANRKSRGSRARRRKKFNVMLPRQRLRRILFDLVKDSPYVSIEWGQRCIGGQFMQCSESKVQTPQIELSFENTVSKMITTRRFDLVVGADGIRSTVRKVFCAARAKKVKSAQGVKIVDAPRELNYLGLMVVLGRAPCNHALTGCTFQTMDGRSRIYAMPFVPGVMMWQLSFPIDHAKGRELSAAGGGAMLKDAQERCRGWHDPIEKLLANTDPSDVTGYPTYDRCAPEQCVFEKGRVCLIGDAVHPMSPFKGQGANQAIIDGYSLGKSIGSAKDGVELAGFLGEFEKEMCARVKSKVEGSRVAAAVLHSEEAIL